MWIDEQSKRFDYYTTRRCLKGNLLDNSSHTIQRLLFLSDLLMNDKFFGHHRKLNANRTDVWSCFKN